MVVQAELAKLPQVEIETNHYFAGGVYCRTTHIPKGMMFTGKIQRRDHIFCVLKGSVYIWTDNGMVTLNAGDVIVAKAGAKRIGYVLEDLICMACYQTDSTDIDEIEREVTVPETLRLFDSSNKLIQIEDKTWSGRQPSQQ